MPNVETKLQVVIYCNDVHEVKAYEPIADKEYGLFIATFTNLLQL